jgi:hypothetical protein
LGQRLPRDLIRGVAASPPTAAAALADRRVCFGSITDVLSAFRNILRDYKVCAFLSVTLGASQN